MLLFKDAKSVTQSSSSFYATAVARLEFANRHVGADIVMEKRHFFASKDDVAADIKRLLGPTSRVHGYAFHETTWVTREDGRLPPIHCCVEETRGSSGQVNAVVTGLRDSVDEMISHLEQKFRLAKGVASVDWIYSDGHGNTDRSTITLDQPPPTRDEFYPWIGEGVNAYQREYLEHSAQILLLMGLPGTGKTSFLRHMIFANKMKVVVTSDASLLSKDDTFATFLTSAEDQLLVVEDADLILASREEENNKMMSLFLSSSDGIVQFPRKKIIFTTNMMDPDRIDSALIRPGRCFDVVHFRALKWDEALAACKAAGIEPPGTPGEYTLAELFNRKHVEFKSRFGFRAA